MVAYMADDEGLGYTYSGTYFRPDPWDPFVLKMKEEIEEHASAPRFNSCLLNLYRNGLDSIAWHSDNEPLYGENPTIASISLGAARDFVMKKIADHSQKWTFLLEPGDLLLMSGTTQALWLHSLPKRLKEKKPRINLTFRNIVN